MKRKNLFTRGAIVIAVLFVINITTSGTNQYSNLQQTSIIPIVSVGDVIKCKCTIWGRCKADGTGAVCAQSEPGGNISCSDYDGNC